MRKNITSLVAIVIVAFITAGAGMVAQDDSSPGSAPCPCSSLYPGYYFAGQYYPFKPVLLSTMPLDVLIGYIIMDSVIIYGPAAYPNFQLQEDFIKSLTCSGDTLKYALKYLYRMADYNPFLYYNFLTSEQAGKKHPMSIISILSDHIKKECGLPTQEVMKAEYILHIETKEVEPFTYESKLPVYDSIYGKTYTDSTYLDYVYCQVLDTIKGQVLPNMENAITVLRTDSTKVFGNLSTSLSAPPNTNFLFYYNRKWVVESGNWKSQTKAEPNKEYILFAYNTRACLNKGNGQYYDIRPTLLGASGGIYPIVDGNVIDFANDFGWGTSVALATFKQNLQNLIDSIKNFGE